MDPLYLQDPIKPAATPQAAKGLRDAINNDSPMMSGFVSGTYGYGGSSLLGLANLAEVAGADSVGQGLRKKATALFDTAQKFTPSAMSLDSVKDFGSGVDYVRANAGQGLGSMLPVIAGGAAGLAPGLAAATAPMYGENIGRLEQDPTLSGMSAGQKALHAAPTAAVQGALNYVVPGGFAAAAGRQIASRTGTGALGKAGVTLGTVGLVEGATEGGEELARQGMHTLANPERDTSGDNKQLLESFVGGMVGGSPIGAVQAGAGYVQDRMAEREQDTRTLGQKLGDTIADAGGVLGRRQGERDAAPANAALDAIEQEAQARGVPPREVLAERIQRLNTPVDLSDAFTEAEATQRVMQDDEVKRATADELVRDILNDPDASPEMRRAAEEHVAAVQAGATNKHEETGMKLGEVERKRAGVMGIVDTIAKAIEPVAGKPAPAKRGSAMTPKKFGDIEYEGPASDTRPAGEDAFSYTEFSGVPENERVAQRGSEGRYGPEQDPFEPRSERRVVFDERNRLAFYKTLFDQLDQQAAQTGRQSPVTPEIRRAAAQPPAQNTSEAARREQLIGKFAVDLRSWLPEQVGKDLDIMSEALMPRNEFERRARQMWMVRQDNPVRALGMDDWRKLDRALKSYVDGGGDKNTRAVIDELFGGPDVTQRVLMMYTPGRSNVNTQQYDPDGGRTGADRTVMQEDESFSEATERDEENPLPTETKVEWGTGSFKLGENSYFDTKDAAQKERLAKTQSVLGRDKPGASPKTAAIGMVDAEIERRGVEDAEAQRAVKLEITNQFFPQMDLMPERPANYDKMDRLARTDYDRRFQAFEKELNKRVRATNLRFQTVKATSEASKGGGLDYNDEDIKSLSLNMGKTGLNNPKTAHTRGVLIFERSDAQTPMITSAPMLLRRAFRIGADREQPTGDEVGKMQNLSDLLDMSIASVLDYSARKTAARQDYAERSIRGEVAVDEMMPEAPKMQFTGRIGYVKYGKPVYVDKLRDLPDDFRLMEQGGRTYTMGDLKAALGRKNADVAREATKTRNKLERMIKSGALNALPKDVRARISQAVSAHKKNPNNSVAAGAVNALYAKHVGGVYKDAPTDFERDDIVPSESETFTDDSGAPLERGLLQYGPVGENAPIQRDADGFTSSNPAYNMTGRAQSGAPTPGSRGEDNMAPNTTALPENARALYKTESPAEWVVGVLAPRNGVEAAAKAWRTVKNATTDKMKKSRDLMARALHSISDMEPNDFRLTFNKELTAQQAQTMINRAKSVIDQEKVPDDRPGGVGESAAANGPLGEGRQADNASAFLKGRLSTAKVGGYDNPVIGDIWAQDGFKIVTTNLGGVHGRGLAKQAKDNGSIQQGKNREFNESPFDKQVITLAVKGRAPETAKTAGRAFSEQVIAGNLDLLSSEIDRLIGYARKHPDKKFYLPYAGLGFGEGIVTDIRPILERAAAEPNILMIAKDAETVGKYSESFKPGVRRDATTRSEAFMKKGGEQPLQQRLAVARKVEFGELDDNASAFLKDYLSTAKWVDDTTDLREEKYALREKKTRTEAEERRLDEVEDMLQLSLVRSSPNENYADVYRDYVEELQDIGNEYPARSAQIMKILDGLDELARRAVTGNQSSTKQLTQRSEQNAQTPGEATTDAKRTVELKAALTEVKRLLGKDFDAQVSNELFDPVSGAAWSGEFDPQQMRILIAAGATDTMGTGRHEALHALFKMLRDMGHQEAVKVIENLAKNAAVMSQLKKHLADHKNALEQLKDPEEAAAYAFQFWMADRLKLGPQAKTFFQKVMDFLNKAQLALRDKVFGSEVAKDERARLKQDALALKLLGAFRDGAMASPEGRVSVQAVLEANKQALEARRLNTRAFGHKLHKFLQQGIYSAASVFEDSANPHVKSLGKMFFRMEGDVRGEKQSFLEAAAQANDRYQVKVRNILVKLDKDTAELVSKYMNNRTELKDIHHPEAHAAVKELRDLLDDLLLYQRNMNTARWDAEKMEWVPMGEVEKNYYPRVWSINVLTEKQGEFIEKMTKALEKYRRDFKGFPEIEEFHADTMAKAILNKLINGAGSNDIEEMTSDLGITPWQASVNKRDLNWLDDVAPGEFTEYFSNDVAEVMTSYISQATKRAEYNHAFGRGGEKIREGMYAAMVHEMGGKSLVESAEHALRDAKRDWAKKDPETRGEKPTLLGEARRILEERIRQEAYSENRAELEKLDPKALEKALDKLTTGKVEERQKEAAEKLEPVTKAIMAMEGTLGREIDPTLRHVMGGVTTFQNFRLLPLALFASINDVVGMVARGGTMKDSFQAFTRGIKEVGLMWKGEYSQDELAKLAERLGTVGGGNYLDAMGQTYSSQFMYGKLRRWNDALFKWNGLEAWNRAARIQATGVAIEFIKRHVEKPNEHSKRYLEELFGKDYDTSLIMKDGDLDYSNDRVREAVLTWVNGAVLRPNASHRPIYASDPHYMLFYHLKQFAYSFHKVILRRAWIEAKAGNYTPAAALFTGYVPVSIAADVVKETLIMGDDDPWWTKGGLTAYLEHGIARANLGGVPQHLLGDIVPDPIAMFKDPGEELSKIASRASNVLGPAPDHLIDLLTVPLFDNKTISDELAGSVPGGVLIRRYVD